MSRNLCRTDCDFCSDEVALVEAPSAILPDECGQHFYDRYYAGMLVANAECTDCGAKYLAWVDETNNVSGSTCSYRSNHTATPQRARYCHHRSPASEGTEERGFVDLSFRSTFNDEPGDDDLPTRTALNEYTIGAAFRLLAYVLFYVCKAMGPPRRGQRRHQYRPQQRRLESVDRRNGRHLAEMRRWWAWFDGASDFAGNRGMR